MADTSKVASTTNKAPTTVPEPENAVPPQGEISAKKVGKLTEISEVVVVETDTFDPAQTHMINEAEEQFIKNVMARYKEAPTDVELLKINHRVGFYAEYWFTGKLGAEVK